MTTHRLAAPLAFAFAVIPACTHEEKTQPPTVAVAADLREAGLLDGGKEPRALLRLHVNKGHRESITFDTKFTMAIEVDGNPIPTPAVPTFRMNGGLEVTDVLDNGDIRYEFRFTDAAPVKEPGVAPEAIAAIEASFKDFSNIKMTILVSPRNMTRDTKIEIPESVNPAIRQTLDSMRESMSRISVPYPEAPVGVGARWESPMDVSANGIKVKGVGSFELLERTGDKVRVKTSVKINSAPQAVKLPNIPPEATVNLESMIGEGAGESKLDLGRVNPDSATTDAKIKMSMRMKENATAKEQRMKMDMDMKMSLTGK